MRSAGRGAAAAIAALIVGFVLALAAAGWLRSASPGSGFLFRVANTMQVASWTFVGAHGVPLEVSAGVTLDDERLGDIGDRIGDLIGRENPLEQIGERGPSADVRVRLSPLTILAAAGAVLAWVMRGTHATDVRSAAAASVVAAVVYGVGLMAFAASSGAGLGFDAAIVRAGVDASTSPVLALVFGSAWGFVFAFIGAVSSTLRGLWLTVVAALGRAAVVAALVSIVCLVVFGIAQGGGGSGGVNGRLAALGVVFLGVNIVGGAVVLAHGAHMRVALDAGPLSDFTRLGYFPSGRELSPARFVFVLVPVLATIAAGRVIAKRTRDPVACLVFGAAWGIALGAIAAMLRVEILSDFSIGSLAAGGRASISPAAAAAAAFAIGTVGSLVGMRTERRVVDDPVPHVAAPTTGESGSCPTCGGAVPVGDSFCGACGARVR
jgi:hypothetical protein